MGKTIDKIVVSSIAPKNTNVLWNDGKILYIYRNGKWESIGLTSEQQDMIQKLLDAYGDLPENLNSIKEIANTPANFLNNNYELGGMVNMPFGYDIRQTFSKHIISQEYKKRILLGNIKETYYYGYIAVASGNYLEELRLSEIANNEINIKSGQIYYDSNTYDVYFLTPPYPIDIIITISVFSDRRLLSKKFIDLEIDWQNNNQDDVNYIKNRTHYISSKDEQYHNKGNNIAFNIFSNVDAYCYAYDSDGSASEIVLIKNNDTSAKILKTSTFDAVIYRTAENSPVFRTTVSAKDPSSIKFVIFTVETLNDYYIPNTIARVADYELPHATFWINRNDKNFETLEKFGSLTKYPCDIYEYQGSFDKNYNVINSTNCFYSAGTISCFSGNGIAQYNVNLETGEITLKHEIDITELYNKISSL